jgi:hypothetical protein
MTKIRRHSKPIPLGANMDTGAAANLDAKWLETHVHIVGPPGSGKTRLMLGIFRRLAQDPRATIVLVNPKGALARMARDAMIADGQSKRVVWSDPGDPEFIMGYNPLLPNELAVATHAKAVREAIRSAWGQSSFDQTPQLARLLYLTLAVSLATGGTLMDALRLLRSGEEGSDVRRTFLAALEHSSARGGTDLLAYLRNALVCFDSLGERRQDELGASTLARLESFVCDPAISRIVTQPRCLDLREAIRSHKILIFNLEIGRPLRIDDVKLLGRFVVNDIVNHVYGSPTPDEPVYLMLDEVQNFATRDLCSILDMGRELGLHCILAHQNIGQLRAEDETGYLYDSVMKCARTKFLFGGLHVEDLDVLVRDACIEEFDPYKVKDELKTLVLDPVEARRDVVSRGWSREASYGAASARSRTQSRVRSVGRSVSKGKTTMHGESTGSTSSSGYVSGSQSGFGGGETMLADGTIIGTSHDMAGTSESDISSYSDTCSETHSRGRHRSESVQVSGASGEAHAVQETRSKSASAGASESTSRVPFYEYEKQWRPSSRTFESEAEFLTKKLQRIKGLPQAHAFVKVPGKTGRFLRLPRVRTPWLPERTRNAGYARIFDRSFYFKPGEPVIAEDLASPTERSPKSLPAAKTGEDLTRCARNALAEVRAVAVEAQNRDEDFAGPDVPIAPRKTRKKKT